MRFTGIPLDIRPYNYQFLEDIVAMDKDVSIKMPNKELLGLRKNPADLDYLKKYILENAANTDAFIISLDMLVYGGLFPSRLHNNSVEELKVRLDVLREIKNMNPDCKIYGSNLILRTPKYNSAEEEPDYYAFCGLDIFKYGHFLDKKARVGLSLEEEREFNEIDKRLNKDYLKDFINRRNKNISVILYALELVKEGIIDILIIPQDDASEFGFTAMDQKKVYYEISKLRIADKVFLHPGTDESGCTLITRAYLDKKGDFSIYPYYITEAFKNIIPNYEDRPFQYSLVSHTQACGIDIVDSINKADAVLAINGAPIKMQEAYEISYGLNDESQRKDISYYRYRNFPEFCKKINKFLDDNKEVSVLDVAFSNGGEKELIEYLDKYKLLERISGYAGWNTCCNSLGTVLAAMTFSYFGKEKQKIENFKVRRLASDWAYQTEVMLSIEFNELKEWGGSFSDFNGKEDELMELIKVKVKNKIDTTFVNSYNDKNIDVKEVRAPFKRMRGLEFIVNVE
ncbi:DUF4127 family protein [Clostridium sp. NSJ-145]|uniref:DUF4127 family protein n=1 Tax=Clostridium sp. NSJ-145 TaxID=2897777 RepID=UPI001E2E1C28|nr:DUF4127 family protein [Clostridium sp. NSJ-145]MCD2501603.1 DUF4127 family protein [Clostridium sp. NSJ-145]